MDIHFGCTMCGRCCHNLKLPVTIAEAIQWIARGGEVQILTEAMPWLIEPAPGDLAALRKRSWSFPGTSGTIPVRIIATLAASFDGACPHLLPDMRCGAYDLRPGVCRIYPAEINPLLELVPARKVCPSEAWAPDQPVLLRDGVVIDDETLVLVERSRTSFVAEMPLRARLCELLGLTTASFSNEGFAIHAPDGAIMLEALRSVQGGSDTAAVRSWSLLSNRAATVGMLRDVGADVVLHADADKRAYVGFFDAA